MRGPLMSAPPQYVKEAGSAVASAAPEPVAASVVVKPLEQMTAEEMDSLLKALEARQAQAAAGGAGAA